jgi:sigma-B regulation protein RsbU (phosphoserine phosphatase)
VAELTNLKKKTPRTEELERELNLKQLQINRLLTITQAINDNVKASGLFNMYSSFLGWEMGVKKMALFYKREDRWVCAASLGISQDLLALDIAELLPKFTRTNNLAGVEHPLFREFDVVVPVRHKDTPIAFAFIGGFAEEDDLYNKVQFITTITNIIAVAIENKRLFKKQLEQERLKHEMELAIEMQRQLVPKSLPQCESYELSSIYQPHLGVGGDYFDVIQFDDGKVIFCIGDISGKGVAAALLMANFQANFHTLIRKRMPLDQFVREINEALVRTTKGERFVTLFVAEYDTQSGALHYINAGHHPPFLVSGETVKKLDRGCTLLGMFPELPQVEVGSVIIGCDSFILTYTDGLTDLQNENEDYFSDDMVQYFVQKHQKLAAREFNQLLLRYLEDFKGSQSYSDDFTVLACKIFQPAHPRHAESATA